jgi:hypothetical protein
MMPEVQTNGLPALVRASIKANHSGAHVVLGVLDGSGDGSLGVALSTDSEIFMDEMQQTTVLFNAISSSVIPVFQVSNLSNTMEVQVFIDNIEVYAVPLNHSVPNTFLWTH